MTDVRALHERLERTFRGAFQVRDIAEALVSFDARMPAAAALERASHRGFAVVGVREGGRPVFLSDVADVTLGPDLPTARVSFGLGPANEDGLETGTVHPAVTMAVSKKRRSIKLSIPIFSIGRSSKNWAPRTSPRSSRPRGPAA